MASRKRFDWKDPVTNKKYKDICTTPKMMRLLEKKIETKKQADSFKEAYAKVSKHAEYNLGYFIGLIKDDDIRIDALELFEVEPQLSPRQMLNPEYQFHFRRH